MDYEKKLQELADAYGDWWNKGFPVPEMTSELYPYRAMFEPITVNKLKLKNRLVMAPMGNIDMCEETGRPNEKMLKYFEERAKGGVGLITTGLIPVSFGIDKSLIERRLSSVVGDEKHIVLCRAYHTVVNPFGSFRKYNPSRAACQEREWENAPSKWGKRRPGGRRFR